MDFLDNRLDQASGTMRARAVVREQGPRSLSAGPVRPHPDARAPAIQGRARAGRGDRHRPGPAHRLCGRCRRHDRQPRAGAVGPRIDGYRVIREGLKGDETIVINGLMRVRPGVQGRRPDAQTLPPVARRRDAAGRQPMSFAHFFVDRPIFAAVLVDRHRRSSAAIAYLGLPVAQYPEIAPPTIVVRASYPGANAETVAATVATPLEQEINGVEDMLYMSSYSTSDGAMSLTITFKLGTDLDKAQVLVQNRVAIADAAPAGGGAPARRHHAQELARPDDGRAHAVAGRHATTSSTSRTMPATTCATMLLRLDGVGDLNIFGEREYSLRVWLDPDKLAAFGMTVGDVVAPLQEQNVQVSGGALGQQPRADRQPPSSSPSPRRAASTTPRQFRHVIVKSTDGRPPGRACRTWRASSSARRTTSRTPTSTASRPWRSPSSSARAPMRSRGRRDHQATMERAEAAISRRASTTRSSTTRPSSSPSPSTRSTRRCSRRWCSSSSSSSCSCRPGARRSSRSSRSRCR